MKYLLFLMLPVLTFAQLSKDIEVYQGDYTVISFSVPGDVSSDSLVLGVKADRDDDTPRVIERRNTAGGGDDTQIEVIYIAPTSTVLVKFTTANTGGLTPAFYVYDLTKDSTNTWQAYQIGNDSTAVTKGMPYYDANGFIKRKY